MFARVFRVVADDGKRSKLGRFFRGRAMSPVGTDRRGVQVHPDETGLMRERTLHRSDLVGA